jgi:hypothetical protein
LAFISGKEKLEDENDLFHLSCVPLEATQILCEAFPDEMANNGAIRYDNV